MNCVIIDGVLKPCKKLYETMKKDKDFPPSGHYLKYLVYTWCPHCSIKLK